MSKGLKISKIKYKSRKYNKKINQHNKKSKKVSNMIGGSNNELNLNESISSNTDILPPTTTPTPTLVLSNDEIKILNCFKNYLIQMPSKGVGTNKSILNVSTNDKQLNYTNQIIKNIYYSMNPIILLSKIKELRKNYNNKSELDYLINLQKSITNTHSLQDITMKMTDIIKYLRKLIIYAYYFYLNKNIKINLNIPTEINKIFMKLSTDNIDNLRNIKLYELSKSLGLINLSGKLSNKSKNYNTPQFDEITFDQLEKIDIIDINQDTLNQEINKY